MKTLSDSPTPWTCELPAPDRARADRAAGPFPGPDRGARHRLLWVSGSVLVHALMLGSIALAPAPPAHAAAGLAVQVELLAVLAPSPLPTPSVSPEPETPSPAPPAAPPLGQLDARRVKVPAPESSPSPVAEPVAAAPSTLTADNPYAQPSSELFTSGSATSGSARRVSSRAMAPGAGTRGSRFGVETGSAQAGAEMTAELDRWYRSVRSRLGSQAAAAYPHRARRLQQEGTARLSVSIAPTGAIVSVALLQTSGHATLDEAALSSLRAVGSVPAPPSGVGTTSLAVPVAFRLN